MINNDRFRTHVPTNKYQWKMMKSRRFAVKVQGKRRYGLMMEISRGSRKHFLRNGF